MNYYHRNYIREWINAFIKFYLLSNYKSYLKFITSEL